MSLRPRYSLLTLLLLFLLTALIVVGVKLWIGPHHVVERPAADWEVEYTFSRNWSGRRVIDGSLISRRFVKNRLDSFEVYYYRQGLLRNSVYRASVLRSSPESRSELYFRRLPKQEQQLVDEAIAAERQRIEAAGFHLGSSIEEALVDGFNFDPNY